MTARQLVPPVLAVGAVAITTAVLRGVDADLTVAALVYTVVIVVAALGGYWTTGVAAVTAYACLNYWFIPRYGAFTFEKADDVVPLVVFAFAATSSGLIVARVDALRRQAAESERAVFEARLEAAVNESRAGFLAAMTHNLRTPLASIKAAVATLRDPTASIDAPTRDRLLATTQDETERLERLVDKVLEISRIHAGALEPDIEPTELGELARAAVRRLRYLAARDRVRLAVAGDEAVATVDPAMIELVLVVLLENALRFAPDGSEITVAVAVTADRGELQVVDHGPGIPPEHRDDVFREFVRLGGPPDAGGSGLGLAIARAIVDAHHGTITIRETPGGGATFVVSLPRGTP